MSWDLKNDRPIYTQLLEQIQTKIISGEYQPGQRLPSVRELAAEAAVNPNTMQRALAELERKGLVFSQRTAGRNITEDEEKIKEMKQMVAEEIIKDFMKNMKKLGYEGQDIIALLQNYDPKSQEV